MRRRMDVHAVEQESPKNFLDRLAAEVAIDGDTLMHGLPSTLQQQQTKLNLHFANHIQFNVLPKQNGQGLQGLM